MVARGARAALVVGVISRPETPFIVNSASLPQRPWQAPPFEACPRKAVHEDSG